MSESERWVPLVAVADIPPEGIAVTYRDGPFDESAIVLVTDGTVRAWKNRCRHLSVPLDGLFPGRFLSTEGHHVVCQEHGALYRADDGFCIEGPPEGESLQRLPIEVRDGTVFLDSTAIGSFFTS